MPEASVEQSEFGFPYEILNDDADERGAQLDIKIARAAYENLSSAFCWKDTIDGFEYWSGVCANLLRIIERGR